MTDLTPIAALADPGPVAQWVGIVVTCAGTFAGLIGLWFAYAAARDAKTAAERAGRTAGAAKVAADRARSAAEEFAAVYELQTIQDDLADLSSLCSTEPPDLAAIARAAARLSTRLGVAAATFGGATRDSVAQAALELLDIPPETANPKTKIETKLYRASGTIASVQAAVTAAQRLLRQTPNVDPNNEIGPPTAASRPPGPT